MREIEKLIFHCSATIEGQNISAATIKRWHVKKQGSHAKGYNKTSIGICYIGVLSKNKRAKDTRTEAQKNALIKLIKTLKNIYPSATLHGHNEFSKKSCPCFKVSSEYAEYQPQGYKLDKDDKGK